jgi:hypothetical protein
VGAEYGLPFAFVGIDTMGPSASPASEEDASVRKSNMAKKAIGGVRHYEQSTPDRGVRTAGLARLPDALTTEVKTRAAISMIVGFSGWEQLDCRRGQYKTSSWGLSGTTEYVSTIVGSSIKIAIIAKQ